MCFDCDAKILIASGIKIALDADLDEVAKAAVEEVLGKRAYEADYFIVENDDLFYSYENFKNRRRGYTDWFFEIEKFGNYFNWQFKEVKYLFRNIPEDARLLFVAASVIINKTSLGDDDEEIYPSYINKLKNEIKHNGGLEWRTDSY
jgi:hypothetical protein